ncbi:MAG: hypothetical protein EOO27_08920 [Comamonadaceae bacterium]|nr:MAG: hypothetical protein EOO27_08920 [Comamonadaceae bacterium]
MSDVWSVMEDGSDLVAWAEPNTIVLNDERCEVAVLRALDSRSEPALARSADVLTSVESQLRPSDPRRLASPLIDAMVSNRRESRRHCDRCRGAKPSAWLWVPCGASVAELAVCSHCRQTLDESFSVLVWR